MIYIEMLRFFSLCMRYLYNKFFERIHNDIWAAYLKDNPRKQAYIAYIKKCE
jgi:hypothetical protein